MDGAEEFDQGCSAAGMEPRAADREHRGESLTPDLC